MNKNFTAIYYDENNYFYNAIIFVSEVTLTIRYKNERGEAIDRYWLGKEIISLDEGELQSTLIFKNERGKAERLAIRDPELLAEIKHQFRHMKFAGKRKFFTSNKTRYRIVAVLAVIVFLIAAVYFFFVPWLGERAANRFSREREIALGNDMYAAIMKASESDTRKTAILNSFYKELHYEINYPVKITVVKSDEVNAFAVPGGHIVVFDGILDNMKTPEELAALLGHEASHVELRHSLRNIFRSMARKVFLLLILGADAGVAGYLADRADDLKGLAYSRALESEADNNGIKLMIKSGLDPHGMLNLMELLQKEAKGKQPSALLSTHPVFESRIKNIRAQLQESGERWSPRPRLVELFHELYESANSY